MSWSRPFDNPIPTAKGKTLVMLKDAAAPPDAQRRPADYDRSAASVFPWPGPQNPQQPNVAGDSQDRMRSESAGSRRGLRCWRHRTATTSGRQRLLLGVSSAHVFRSWGKRPPVAGTPQTSPGRGAHPTGSACRREPEPKDRGCTIGVISNWAT